MSNSSKKPPVEEFGHTTPTEKVRTVPSFSHFNLSCLDRKVIRKLCEGYSFEALLKAALEKADQFTLLQIKNGTHPYLNIVLGDGTPSSSPGRG